MTIAYSTDQTLNYSFRRTSSLEYHGGARWNLATAKVSFPTSSTTQYKWGTTSINYNGTDQTVSFSSTTGATAASSVASGGLLPTGSSGAWTCECWFWMASADMGTQRAIFDAGTNGVGVGIHPTNKIFFGTSGVSYGLISTGTFSGNTWNHFCWMRSGSSTYVFINGVASSGSSANYTTGTAGYGGYIQPQIGYNTNSSPLIKGYMQDFRISNAAMYSTSGFTPPTGPLTNQSSTIILIPGYDGTIKDNPYV